MRTDQGAPICGLIDDKCGTRFQSLDEDIPEESERPCPDNPFLHPPSLSYLPQDFSLKPAKMKARRTLYISAPQSTSFFLRPEHGRMKDTRHITCIDYQLKLVTKHIEAD